MQDAASPACTSHMRWSIGINWSAVRLPFAGAPLAQFEEEFGLKPARQRNVQFTAAKDEVRARHLNKR